MYVSAKVYVSIYQNQNYLIGKKCKNKIYIES